MQADPAATHSDPDRSVDALHDSRRNASASSVSYPDDLDFGIELPNVVGIRSHDSLACAAGAHHDMGIGDVGGAAGGEQTADTDGVRPVQWHHRGVR